MVSLDPRKLRGMMKQLGIKQEEIDAERVIIEKADGRTIIENPGVARIIMQGQESWQITGNAREETEKDQEKAREEDIKTIIEKTNCTYEEAKKALEKTSDLAEAILELSK